MPWSANELISEENWAALRARLQLSEREVQIAQAVLEDRKELAIAMDLGISPHTVHTHLERLYRKLGVDSRLGLAVRLMRCQNELIAEPGSALKPVCARHAEGRCPVRD
ncbi:response regulator transcription factor [Mucisphaera sp.]|uniref:response regulator transcription factor n=1 Tax=Mucisphaera sp. TaxID=2913024 RepID=UPI003D0CBA0E